MRKNNARKKSSLTKIFNLEDLISFSPFIIAPLLLIPLTKSENFAQKFNKTLRDFLPDRIENPELNKSKILEEADENQPQLPKMPTPAYEH